MVRIMGQKSKKAVTLVEVMIVLGLFSILMIAAYNLFFSEIRSIKTALEHITVNENARKLFSFMASLLTRVQNLCSADS